MASLDFSFRKLNSGCSVNVHMNERLEKFAACFASVLGTSWAFLGACIIFVSWLALAGLREAFERPGLFIVEFTGLFIFVHLFIVQRNNNKDIKALHLKLDELIATIDGANNHLIKAEQAPEFVVDQLHQKYVEAAGSIDHPTKSICLHSIDEQLAKASRE